MRDDYDFSDSVPNPYARQLKKQVTLDLDEETANYFQGLAKQKGIPYPSLLNLYLKECAAAQRDVTHQGAI
jgi:hypothetical protein